MHQYLIIYLFVFLISFALTAIIEKKLIPILSRSARQPIYEGGPKWHSKKSGTPTMGGLAFLIAIIISAIASVPFLWLSDKDAIPSLLICITYALMNALIGITDDTVKLKRKQNEGLTPKQKLLLQFIIAVLFLLARKFILGEGTTIAFSFGDIDLGFAYYVFSVIILLGIVNCANLTDGVDGLASGVAFGVGISLFYICSFLCSEGAVISSAIIGAVIAFLIFNLHPAKVFMGDTGSLFLGALAVSIAFALGNPFLIIAVGGIYVIEGITVILQVLFYKATKKRLFLMAPIHHHLERLGLSENSICIIAILITFIMSVPAYLLYLP